MFYLTVIVSNENELLHRNIYFDNLTTIFTKKANILLKILLLFLIYCGIFLRNICSLKFLAFAVLPTIYVDATS